VEATTVNGSDPLRASWASTSDMVGNRDAFVTAESFFYMMYRKCFRSGYVISTFCQMSKGLEGGIKKGTRRVPPVTIYMHSPVP
jgi:hypothetical protein